MFNILNQKYIQFITSSLAAIWRLQDRYNDKSDLRGATAKCHYTHSHPLCLPWSNYMLTPGFCKMTTHTSWLDITLPKCLLVCWASVMSDGESIYNPDIIPSKSIHTSLSNTASNENTVSDLVNAYMWLFNVLQNTSWLK